MNPRERKATLPRGFRRGLAGILLLLLPSVFATAAAPTTQTFGADVARYMEAQTEINRFSGSILVAQNSKVLVAERYAPRSGPEGQDAGHYKYRVGSIAKQFIAAAMLQLQEQGKLQLTDFACKYIANCPSSWQEITIFDLLVQTDGIPEVSQSLEGKLPKPVDTAQLLRDIEHGAPGSEPGKRFRYGNSGYEVLAAIVEKVSGKAYPTEMTDRIFDPLEMHETGYERSKRLGPSRHQTASITPNDLDSTANYSWSRFYSSVEDLYRWDQKLDREGFLSKDSRKQMFTPYVDGYGFGWATLKEFGRRMQTQAAGITLFGSAIRRYPDDDACVIVLSDSDNADAGKISRDLAAILFGKHYELPVEHSAANVDPAIYDSYVGRYEMTPDFALIVNREANHLTIQGQGQEKVAIVPDSETRFHAEGLDAEVDFVKGPEGKVSQLVLQQGGRDIPARKVE